MKQVLAEPRGGGDGFDKAIAKYYAAVRSGRGGLFMAVCRGKVRPHAGCPAACGLVVGCVCVCLCVCVCVCVCVCIR